MRKGIVGTGGGDSEKCLRGRVEEVNSMAEGKGSELTPSSGLGNTGVGSACGNQDSGTVKMDDS